MIEAPHYNSAGAKRDSAFSLPAEYFDGTVNEPVLHQAVKVFLNNQRQGTHMTKSRSFVSGGNQKPWKQKGTGRARQGSIRAPHWRGGRGPFGPTPRGFPNRNSPQGASARPKERIERPGPGRCCPRRRTPGVPITQDGPAGRAADEPWARWPEGAGPDSRPQHECLS